MTRFKRAVKIAGPWRVGVSLVGGVVLSVLVAWMLQEGYIGRYLPEANYFPLDEYELYSSTAGHNLVHWDTVDFSPGTTSVSLTFMDLDYVWDQYQWVPTPEETVALPGFVKAPARLIARDMESRRAAGLDVKTLRGSVEAAGLPMRCMRDWQYTFWDRTIPGKAVPDYVYKRAIRIRSPRHGSYVKLSYSPIWGGLLFNTIFYGLPIYGLLSIPACISGLRRRITNRCCACGYSLDGLTAGSCPECNLAIKRRRLKKTPSD